jgi:head-tail adaptor
MAIGELRHLVTLENPGVPVPDGEGGWTAVPAPLSPSQVWASITPATARDLERMVASTVQASASHIVIMRYHPGVNTSTKILFGSRILYVRGVQNVDERNITLRIAAEEAVT